MLRKQVIFWSGLVLLLGCSGPDHSRHEAHSAQMITAPLEGPQPPIAMVKPHKTVVHGITMVDDYYWLKDRTRSKSEVLEYLNAENAYTLEMMKHTAAVQENLFKEMIGRIKETDLAVPARRGDYYYYTRTEQGKQYSIFCRKKGHLEAAEEIILDVNKIAVDYDYFSIGSTFISPDHRYMAYTYDTTGEEIYSLAIKDLTSGGLLGDTVENISSLAWANDNKTFFYCIDNDASRSYKVFRHVLGTDRENDELVFHEQDEGYYVWVERTKSEAFIILGSGSSKTSEIRYLDANTPAGDFKLIHAREQGMEYYPVHRGAEFFILTNADGARNYKVMTAPVSGPVKSNWTEFIPAHEHIFVSEIDVLQDYFIMFERDQGLQKIRIRDLREPDKEHYVHFPEPIYTVMAHNNFEFNARKFRLHYTSLITPDSVYDYDLENRTVEVLKQEEVLGGYDPAEYQSERTFATAADGTKVPISLVYKKSLFRKDGSQPLFLESYGAYGISSDPYFYSIRLSLLDRGFIYAIAHIRGGRELGEIWYEQGRMLHKKNTFTDFIACAEHLCSERYTAPKKIVIYGGSAGGLLIGAVTNMRPDLIAVSLVDVPFVDVLNTMLDPTLPATVTEYEEWGNPTIKEYFDYIKSYCPYQNVEAKDYPHMLLMGGFYDPRVQYWEPAKLTAKLRAMKTDANKLLLKINMSGHGGASGRYDFIKEIAFAYTFVFDVMKIPLTTPEVQ